MNTDIHSHTPQLAVIDSRGLPVRQIAYWRQDAGELIAQAWVNRTVFDPAGRAIAQWDPRLFQDASAPANLSTLHGLSGVELCTRSVDAGWRVNLLGETGAPMQSWDGRGSRRSWEYDDQLRPLAVFEQAAVGEASCTERMVYGVGSQAFADHNQCGQLIRHDDPAGTCHFSEFGLTGALLDQQQHFLQALDSPDWPLPVNERDALLEPGAGAHSAFHFNPLGELLEQTDAQGNRQRFNQTVDGQLRDAWLHLNHAPQAQRLVSGMDYNAQGQIERQAAGNGVISQWDYCTKDGRLVRLHAKRANGEPLQDLNYGYDPVGNILSIEDKALPVRYFANQRIEPINRYGYDSLYQLIEATGWEAGSANKGPSSIEDPQAVANYRQTYRYDVGGNLLELIHHGPQQHGRRLTAAKHSNRCLPERNGLPPTEAEIAAGFDDNGNLQALEPGRILSWDTRNQLHHVSPVERASELNDTERYIYDADGMRQRKVRSTQTSARTVISETRYLPGLEVRNIEGEVLHVITAQAGGATVQVLHWETRVPKHLGNDPYRYSLADHLGSCALELDSEAKIISREIYHPYGSTAFSDRGDSSEESYRTLRYSGRERDATGLYYYGFRYYVTQLQRWLNPDPAGDIDGLNFYQMVNNNPVKFFDELGLNGVVPDSVKEWGEVGRARSLKIYDFAKANTLNPKWTNAKKERVKLENLANNSDYKYEPSSLKSLVAHSYGMVPLIDARYIGFFNLDAPKQGPTGYPGVDKEYASVEKNDEFYMDYGTYKINNVPGYLDGLEKDYEGAIINPLHISDFRPEELAAYPTLSRTVAGSHTLQPVVKEWISTHIESSNNIIPLRAGGPGAHAEVRLLNTVVALHPNDSERVLSDLYVSTDFMSSSSRPSDFIGCYNCSGIIPDSVTVLTGRSPYNYENYNRAVLRNTLSS